MARKKASTQTETPTATTAAAATPAEATASAPVSDTAHETAAHLQPDANSAATSVASDLPKPYAPIQALPRGENPAVTIDNRLGYRKEDVTTREGVRRQIRFADREGGRPDDETLAPVREEKPAIKWASREKAWQARKSPDGLEAIDSADQRLAEIGRKRTGGPER